MSEVGSSSILAHWIATYGIAETNVPWPLGVVIAVTPIVLGALLIKRMAVTGPYGSDDVRVVAGLLFFFAVLYVFVGLSGRYDLAVGGLATAYAARRLAGSPRGTALEQRLTCPRSTDASQADEAQPPAILNTSPNSTVAPSTLRMSQLVSGSKARKAGRFPPLGAGVLGDTVEQARHYGATIMLAEKHGLPVPLNLRHDLDEDRHDLEKE